MRPQPYTQLPRPVDLEACTAVHAAPPEPFAPAAESAETSWAVTQQDFEG